jgi:hypothetical protein
MEMLHCSSPKMSAYAMKKEKITEYTNWTLYEEVLNSKGPPRAVQTDASSPHNRGLSECNLISSHTTVTSSLLPATPAQAVLQLAICCPV